VGLLALACAVTSLGAAENATPEPAIPKLPAFSGAEGYGSIATGARGRKVIAVANLQPAGPGSLRTAIDPKGQRIVVFRVSGTIEGTFEIKHGDITIAHQTAPGDGICIKGNLAVGASNVIILHLRCRQNTAINAEDDAIGGRFQHDIIVDHVSASWSGDEVMSFYHNRNVKIQMYMISEACAKFIDGKNTGHQFGGILGNNYGTYHHNLIADNVSRNPRWASGCRYNDYRNNVVYNWKYRSSYGGEAGEPNAAQFNFSTINTVANYYKPGPATEKAVRSEIVAPDGRSSSDRGSWYVSGNVAEGSPEVTVDNWKGVKGNSYVKLESPWKAMPIREANPAGCLRCGPGSGRLLEANLRFVGRDHYSGCRSWHGDVWCQRHSDSCCRCRRLAGAQESACAEG
jgi:pectate lyase